MNRGHVEHLKLRYRLVHYEVNIIDSLLNKPYSQLSKINYQILEKL